MKLKILICGNVEVPPPYGGVAKRVLLHAREWISAGNEVYILVPTKKEKEDLLNVPVRLIYGSKSRTIFALTSWVFKNFFKKPILFTKLFFKLISHKLYNVRYLIYIASYGVRFNEVLNELKPDIVNIHNAFGKSFVATLVCKKKGIPIVLTSYAEMFSWREEEKGEDWSKKYRKMFKYVAENSNHIISPSEHCARGPLKYVPINKVTVVFSGVDAQNYESYLKIKKENAKKKIGLDNKKIVLFVGQLHWRKGPQYLAKAAPKIIREVPNVVIVFIGSDLGMKKEIEDITAEIKKNISIAGFVSEEDLPIYLRAADVFIFPSLTKRECMGMSMKEAMLLETPVVGFDVGGTSEAVINGETGFLVKVEDYKALSDKIIEILKNEKLREKFSRNSRNRALRLFDSRVTGKKCLEIFR